MCTPAGPRRRRRFSIKGLDDVKDDVRNLDVRTWKSVVCEGAKFLWGRSRRIIVIIDSKNVQSIIYLFECTSEIFRKQE